MKKIIKIFFLFLVIFILNGCTIEYNLEFNDEKLNESINVYLQGTEYEINTINNLKGIKPYAISSGLEQEPYNVSFSDTGTEFIANYKYNFTVDNFNKTYALNSCYDAFALTQEDDYYLLSTSKSFNCLMIDYAVIDKVKIKIKTNHEVLEHNADYEEDNVYIWEINNPNKLIKADKPISIKFSKMPAEDNSILNNNMFIVGMFVIGITLVGGIIFLIAYSKNRKSNMK